jgi:5'-deoxynucleotidase
MLAHALVALHNVRFGGALSCERAATLALFHDVPEVLTGDLPTPVKYYNANLRQAYGQVEQSACARLLQMLPDQLRSVYAPLLSQNSAEDAPLLPYVKAADKLSALVKCMEERKAGNCEFACAEASVRTALQAMQLPAVNCFLAECLPAYEEPLDQLTMDDYGK